MFGIICIFVFSCRILIQLTNPIQLELGLSTLNSICPYASFFDHRVSFVVVCPILVLQLLDCLFQKTKLCGADHRTTCFQKNDSEKLDFLLLVLATYFNFFFPVFVVLSFCEIDPVRNIYTSKFSPYLLLFSFPTYFLLIVPVYSLVRMLLINRHNLFLKP